MTDSQKRYIKFILDCLKKLPIDMKCGYELDVHNTYTTRQIIMSLSLKLNGMESANWTHEFLNSVLINKRIYVGDKATLVEIYIPHKFDIEK